MAKREQAGAAEAPVKEPPRYSREVLVQIAERHLGVKPWVVAGALHGVEGALTLDEARRRIEQFLNRRVR